MRRNLIFALLSFVPLALGGVALADHADEHHEHEEHEHYERGRGPRIIIAPPVPYSAPPQQYAPEDSDQYVPEDSDRSYGDDRYYDRGQYRRRGTYSEPPPPDAYRY